MIGQFRIRERLDNATNRILLCVSLVTLICTLPDLVDLLRYSQAEVVQGQLWRPFTAWATQLNIRHWLLNQWGLVILALLLPSHMHPKQWFYFLFVWLVSSVLLWQSDYDNYVGLSGLLYGWLVLGAVMSVNYSLGIKIVFIALVSLKVFSENGFLPFFDSDWVGRFIQARVAHESHLWGLLSGFIAIGLLWIAQRFPRKRAHPDS